MRLQNVPLAKALEYPGFVEGNVSGIKDISCFKDGFLYQPAPLLSVAPVKSTKQNRRMLVLKVSRDTETNRVVGASAVAFVKDDFHAFRELADLITACPAQLQLSQLLAQAADGYDPAILQQIIDLLVNPDTAVTSVPSFTTMPTALPFTEKDFKPKTGVSALKRASARRSITASWMIPYEEASMSCS